MNTRVLRWLLSTSLVGAVIVLGGNRLDPWLWAYVLAFTGMGGYAINSMTDDLARERFRPPEPGADRLSLRAVRIIGFGHVVVGVLDNRFAWTPVPSSLRGAGLLVLVAGFALFIRAMRTNRFFSAVVRIQSDRGHHVVDVGPYARVRHPGYAAMILAIPGSGLALGSWLAFGIGLVYSALILRRVRFEDGFLRAHLEGYGEYAQRVRYRLVPGLW